MLDQTDRGGNMGLNKWNKDIREEVYPPETIADAISDNFFRRMDVSYNSERAQNLVELLPQMNYRLPNEMLTWSGGQLTGIGRNGMFFKNISRYEEIFNNTFENKSKRRNVTVVALDDFANNFTLRQSLYNAFQKSPSLSKLLPQPSLKNNSIKIQRSITYCSIDDDDEDELETEIAHRNPGAALEDKNKEPDESDFDMLTSIFAEDVRLLEKHCNRVFYNWRRPSIKIKN